MIIQRGSYVLRELCAADLPLVLEWRNQARIREFMFTSHEIPWVEHAAWFRRIQADPSSRQFVFELGGSPAGLVGFTGIGSADGVASWGFYLGEKNLPKGTGTRMLALALELAFGTLGASELRSDVLAFNEASVSVHTRLGFKSEGVATPVRIGDTDSDVLVFVLRSEEWSIAGSGSSDGLIEESESE